MSRGYLEYNNQESPYIPNKDPRSCNVKQSIDNCNKMKKDIPKVVDDTIEMSELKKLMKEGISTPDLAQNDSTAPDYVKNTTQVDMRWIRAHKMFCTYNRDTKGRFDILIPLVNRVVRTTIKI